MKKRGFILGASFALLAITFTSCSAGGHLCDAYGSIDVKPLVQPHPSDKQQIILPSLSTEELADFNQKS